jgi:hypothetical protein
VPQTITGLHTASVVLAGPDYASPVTIDGTVAVSAGLTGLFGLAAYQAWDIANFGAVLATADEGTGISLAAAGVVINVSGAVISGYDAGLVITGAAGTLINAGSIAASESYGGTIGLSGHAEGIAVFLGAGGTVSNLAGGTIQGGAIALDLAAGTGAGAYNAGTITEAPAYGAGVRLGAGDTLSNAASGVISASGASSNFYARYPDKGAGVDAIGAAVTNAGTIIATGFNASGVELARGATLLNAGTVAGYAGAVYAYDPTASGSVNVIVNTATITANELGVGDAVKLRGDAYLTNAQNAAILSTEGGISAFGGTATLLNAGLIDATGRLAGNGGVDLYAPGMLSNAASGTIAGQFLAVGLAYGGTFLNAGLVTGGSEGLLIREGTATNSGTIATTSSFSGAVQLDRGVLDNSGVIAGWNAVVQRYYSALGTATIVNSGTIEGIGGGTTAFFGIGISLAGGILTNTAQGYISGDYEGVSAENHPGTVINAGQIVETGTAGHGAVALYPGGYVLNEAGAIIAAAHGSGVAIAGSGTDVGTLVNAGTIIGHTVAYSGFTAASAALVEVEPGATFIGHVYGTELLLGGTAAATLGGLLDIAGFPGQYIGFSTLAFAPGATWAVAGSFAAFGYYTYHQNPIIRGFQAGDAITLNGLSATGYAFSGPFLTLTGGAYGPVTLDLDGGLSAGTFSIQNETTATVLTTDRTILSGAVATLTGTYTSPVRLAAPYYAASVTNLGAATEGISASQPWTLVNEGSVGGRYGILLADGGVVTNAAGAYLGGPASSDGIRNEAGALTLDNAGTIDARYFAAARGASTVINEATGTILGYGGVSGTQTLINAGTIEGTASAGAYISTLAGNPTVAVTNAATGLILGQSSGVDLNGSDGSILNQGRIAASGATGAGMIFSAAGVIDNTGTASIIGGRYGIEALTAFTLTNAGTISASGTSGFGVGQRGGYEATLTNVAGGFIGGETAGVSLRGDGIVTNAGSIIADAGAGFSAAGGLTLSNAASGIIEGSTLGVGAPAAFANATIINAGTIGALSAGGTAVAFGAGHRNELEVYPGARFIGTILGGNTLGASYASNLVLRSGSGVGTIAGFTDFSYITIEPGAAWDVVGSTGVLGGIIRGFMPGDTIDLQGVTASSVAIGNGIVTLLSAGSVAATLRMPVPLDAGAFGVTSDGAGGVMLTASGPTTPRSILAGTYGFAVYLDAAHYTQAVTVTGAVSVHSVYSAIVEYTGSPWTVVNQGRIINADSAAGVGLYLYDGGFVSNAQGATIAGGFDGIYLDAAGTVINAGFVTAGSRGAGVNIDALGTSSFTNLATGTVISSGYEGLALFAPGGAVNEGFITGSDEGVAISHGATLVNAAGGRIAGGFYGVSFGANGTLVNDGTITGGVLLANGEADRVVLAPTAVLSGYVGISGGGFEQYGQVLELAAGTQPGTLGGIGGSIVAFGTVVFDPGSQWTIAGSLTGLAAGDILDTGSAQITFEGFTVGDTIDIAGFAATQSAFVGGLLTLVGTQGSITSNQLFSLPGAFATSDFQVTGDGHGGTDISVVACFAAGTRLLGDRGEIPVEALRVGDRLLAQGGRLRPVRWIGRRRLAPARHARPWDVNPVRVSADAFAPGMPRRDLLLSPDHAVFLGGRLIPIRYLLNGATIAQEETASVTYFHVELDAHDLVLAEGLACESYLDTGNRHAFADEGAVAMLHPAFGREAWAQAGCAELLLDGEAVIAARTALLARATTLGWRLAVATPAIEVDGRPVMPSQRGARHVVRLPQGARRLRLISASGRPGETTAAATDMRLLGLALAHLALDGRPLALSDARLGTGWHPAEATPWRWTDGDAEVDIRGAHRFEFDLMLGARFWVRQEAENIAAPRGGRAARSRG